MCNRDPNNDGTEPYGLPDTLRALRTIFGFSQKDLADILHLKRPTYSYYESGKTSPSIDTLHRLSLIYGIPVDAFFEHDKVQNCLQEYLADQYCNLQGVFEKTEYSFSPQLNSDEKVLIGTLRLLPPSAVNRIYKRVAMIRKKLEKCNP